jgi:hypothetical protein
MNVGDLLSFLFSVSKLSKKEPEKTVSRDEVQRGENNDIKVNK